MSHGADGGVDHGGGGGHHDSGGMHGLGFDHGGYGHHSSGHGVEMSFGHGLESHHGGGAMLAALNGHGEHASHSYGPHAVVFASGFGLLSGGHVISTVSHAGPVLFHHDQRPDGGTKNWRSISKSDIEGADLLVAHALGLVDRGSGWYGPWLDRIATQVGLMRIDSRPNLKGEDANGLDGILPWDAWGNPKSRRGPDSYLPGMNGCTDKIVHIYAIPQRMKVNGVWKMAVSPDETVVAVFRLTVWHNAQTRDVELKLEGMISSGYVYDPYQNNQYTRYGRRTKALTLKNLELTQKFFEAVTAEGEHADPAARKAYAKVAYNFPHTKGHQHVNGDHPVDVHVGTSEERDEIEAEDEAEIRRTDRQTENEVAGSGTITPAPAGDGATDDGASLSGPEGPTGAVVHPPAAVPAGQVSGTFVIPNDLRD